MGRNWGRVFCGFMACLVLVAVPAVSAQNSRGFAGKKILWVDSYHVGYPVSDELGRAISRELSGTGVALRAFHMDSKRRSSDKELAGAVGKARAVIAAFKPDLIIASDDNAVRHLVVPYLKGTTLPVVFCGVNWDASAYGLPAANVTGMVEVDPVETQVAHLARFARGERIGYLSGDLYTERKIAAYYNRHFFAGRMVFYPVSSMRGFKEAFLRAQDEVDMLYISNSEGIADWDAGVAERFVVDHVRIPTGSHNRFMAPFVLVTLSKDFDEQGEWAARAALKILSGVDAAEIPLARNQRGELTVNLRMAKALGVVFPVSTLRAARVIGQDVFTSDAAPAP